MLKLLLRVERIESVVVHSLVEGLGVCVAVDHLGQTNRLTHVELIRNINLRSAT